MDLKFCTQGFLESLITNLSSKYINSKWRIQYGGWKCKKFLDWDELRIRKFKIADPIWLTKMQKEKSYPTKISLRHTFFRWSAESQAETLDETFRARQASPQSLGSNYMHGSPQDSLRDLFFLRGYIGSATFNFKNMKEAIRNQQPEIPICIQTGSFFDFYPRYSIRHLEFWKFVGISIISDIENLHT